MKRKFETAIGMSAKDYRAYRAHHDNAVRRGIDWQFTVQEWWDWWHEYDPRHGCIRWDRRGRKAGGLMMGRIGDNGPYSPTNVYCASAQDNQNDTMTHYNFSEGVKASYEGRESYLKGKRGDDHHASKAVITPEGRFGSIALASEAAGITRQAGFYRVKNGVWKYADDILNLEYQAPPDGQ